MDVHLETLSGTIMLFNSPGSNTTSVTDLNSISLKQRNQNRWNMGIILYAEHKEEQYFLLELTQLNSLPAQEMGTVE
jgi:hypothetical protein